MSTTSRSVEPHWLDEREMSAWLGYRRLRLDAEIARDLEQDSGLSMADYDVLSVLEDATDHTARIGVLAEMLMWSQSRLSRQLARMQSRGLVERVPAPTDKRGFTARLTPRGLAAIVEAAPGHVESVRRHMIDLLADDQLDTLAALATIVLDHLDRTAAPRPIDVD